MESRGVRLASVALAVLAGTAATDLVGQTDTRLVAAVKLAENGLNDSARAMVRRILGETPSTDSSYSEVLFTSGLLAATDYERRVALRRVILEFGQSPWADDALLMLAQVEYANGNPGATVLNVTRLVNDYPSTPLKAVGAFWGARAAGDMRDGAAACRLAEIGLSATTDDVELRNQLQFQLQRCRALAQLPDSAARPNPAGRDSAANPAPPPVPTPPPAAPRGPRGVDKGFRVQVIAAPTQAAADQTAGRLTAAGYQAVVVKEGGLFKVRTQAFATRAQAQQALVKIRTALRAQPFIVVDK